MKKGIKKEETVKPEENITVINQPISNEISENPEENRRNNQLSTILIIFGILFVISFFLFYMVISTKSFEIEGVDFKMVKEGNLLFYNTAIKIYDGGRITGNFIGDYNFYLRKDPRKISKDVELDGQFFLMKNVVLNSEEEFNCNGDGIIAVANMVSLFEKMGATVIKDEKANCTDSAKKYTYINIKEGTETKIVQSGITCYTFYINNCEILDVTERFMLEAFKEIEKKE